MEKSRVRLFHYDCRLFFFSFPLPKTGSTREFLGLASGTFGRV